MNLINKKPVTIAEVKEHVKSLDETTPIRIYIKKFSSLSKADALKLIEELRALNNVKLKEENFIKIADFLPVDAEDLNKICNETSLSEEEIQAILAIVKKYS